MTQRQNFIDELWEKYLLGGIVLSEFSAFIAHEGEITFVAGADLATVLVCQAGIESHLKFENAAAKQKSNFSDLIDQSDLDQDLKNELHIIRRYRNKWVHISDPSNDQHLQTKPEIVKLEQVEFSKRAIASLIRVLCHNPWV